MGSLLLLALLSLPPIQEEPLYRDRVEKLVVQLDGTNERDANEAARELQNLSTTLIPMIMEIAATHPRAADRIRTLLPPEPWARFLKRPIGHARYEVQAILTGKGHDRDRIVKMAIRGLACIPPDEAKAILDRLSKDPDPAAQDFAATAKRLMYSRAEESFGALLGSPVSCERAADLVIMNGETSAIPQAVDLFCRGEEPESGASARVLEAFGAGEFADRIAGVLKRKNRYFAQAVRILGRTGGGVGEKALREALGAADPDAQGSFEIVRQLYAMGVAESDPALRRYFATKLDTARDKIDPGSLWSVGYAKSTLAALRRDTKPFTAMSLQWLHRTAYPELKEDVLAWVNDPSVKTEQLKYLLPLLGAVGGKEFAPILVKRLSEPNLAGGAAQGLAMIGDPSNARDVWNAFLKSGTIFLNSSMISFPPEALEDELVADFTKSEFPNARAIQLARVNLTPKMRKALFERLLITKRGFYSMWDVPLLLGEARDDQEKEWVSKLRASDHHNRMFGHFLAMRGGSAEAAQSLADLWAGYDDWGTFRNPQNIWNWRACEATGTNWKQAVEKAWRNKPAWAEGMVELARWGVKDAVESLRESLKSPNFQARDHGLRALARQGDPAALEWFLEQLLRMSSFRYTDDELLDALMEDESFRRRIRILARCGETHPSNWALELLANRVDSEVLPLYRTGALAGSSACLRALVRVKDPEAFALTIRHLRTASVSGRLEAIRLLGEMGNRAGVPPLLDMIDDLEESVDPNRAREGYRMSHEAPPVKVAAAAMAALEKLTGVKSEKSVIADRRDFWRDWSAKNRDSWK